MLRFLHAADLHIDSPLYGLERYEGAPVAQLRGATRRAMENLVSLALEEKVHLVLLAGDLYDGDWRDYNTGLFFSQQMSRLREAHIPVVRLRGNHDAQSEITRHLKLPDNVVDLPSERPQTHLFEDIGVAVHGQSFAERAVTKNLAGAYPAPKAGLFNIGLLHTALAGREGHDSYAPCTTEELVAKGYDYWALGHVHQREIVHKEPYIVFPGNTQGRHVRESGAKGCTLVTVEGDRVDLAHRDLDVLRWRLCRIEARGARDPDSVLDMAEGALQQLLQEEPDRLLAVRLVIQGACRAHAELQRNPEQWIQQLRARATDVSSGRLWLEKIRFDTHGQLSLEQLRDRDDVYGSLSRAIHELKPEDAVIKSLDEEWKALRNKLPPELLQDAEFADQLSPERLQKWREELAWFLLPRLLSGKEGA